MHTESTTQPTSTPTPPPVQSYYCSCAIPLAAWGRIVGDQLALDAAVFDPDGRERVAAAAVGSPDDPEALGVEVARLLREQGAGRLLEGIRKS